MRLITHAITCTGPFAVLIMLGIKRGEGDFMTEGSLILAPLRGVTIRCFRETFAAEIAAAGFTEAVTPFITANAGVDPLKDREIGNWRIGELANGRMSGGREGLVSAAGETHRGTVLGGAAGETHRGTVLVTPQFIGKDPGALRYCLKRIKSVGYTTADLNCGCPFPMVRNKGRGSGILRTPNVLRQMMEVGCEVMGSGNFSIKARLGVDRTDELLKLMPLINEFPLRHLTLHARTAKQMYEGACDWTAGEKVVAAARVPVVLNGDLEVVLGSAAFGCVASLGCSPETGGGTGRMIGRSFVRALGARPDSRELLLRYIAASQRELSGDRPVLGRMKELLSYWKEIPYWSRRWNLLKICRSVDELRAAI